MHGFHARFGIMTVILIAGGLERYPDETQDCQLAIYASRYRFFTGC